MSKSTDGWTTIRRGGAAATGGGGGGGSGYRRWGDSSAAGAEPPREMPSAFGGGRARASREEEARRAWDERRAVVEKERAAKAEAERQAKIMNFSDTEQYPTLGGGGAAPKLKPKVAATPMNFRDMARETAARSALEEAEAAAAAKRRELDASRRTYSSMGAGPRLYRHGSYDDGPVDHGYPDEEGYYPPDGEDDYAAGPPPEEGEGEGEEDDMAEYNAELAVTRRRGDKSDW